MLICVAPLQGFTEAPFRHFHSRIYGGADYYFSPFVRIEHGEPRRRDMNDIRSELNKNHHVVPQIIFRDIHEFDILVEEVARCGYGEIDLNMGCPFPPQVNRGRGAGTLLNKSLLEEVAARTQQLPEINFSVKMRLGVKSAAESFESVTFLNSMKLSHVTVHPRIAVQQYSGELMLDDFADLSHQLKHRVIFNGDILSPDDIDRVMQMFPDLYGIMIGRGILRRPSLIAEWRDRRSWDNDAKKEKLLELHACIFDHYASTLCGDSQILSKIKPFWEYLESEIGSKQAKRIRKSKSVSDYLSAVNGI